MGGRSGRNGIARMFVSRKDNGHGPVYTIFTVVAKFGNALAENSNIIDFIEDPCLAFGYTNFKPVDLLKWLFY